MTGKPDLTIEQLLTRYEQYDTQRRAAHIPHPSKAGFVVGFPKAGFGKSKGTLYNYAKHWNLPWPLLPEDESVLVWVLFRQPPFELTWVRRSVATTLGMPVEDIVNQPSNELMRHGVGFDDQTRETLRRVMVDSTCKEASAENVWIDVADGCCQLTNMQVRYTGALTDRFYVTAQLVGVPYQLPNDGDVFNVQPDLFYRMERVPVPVALRT